MELIDYSRISNIEFEGIDYEDYPDFCDTYIVSAELDGIILSEDEIDKLNEDRELVYEKLWDYLH